MRTSTFGKPPLPCPQLSAFGLPLPSLGADILYGWPLAPFSNFYAKFELVFALHRLALFLRDFPLKLTDKTYRSS